ncbi:class I SAM-dependent methyltransferase [Geoglobus sp.]
MPDSRDIARTFDLFAERYDSWYDRNSQLFEKEVSAIPRPSFPSLEVGCGSGRFMERLGIDVGVDISEGLIALARRRGLQVMLADGKDLPFRDGAFSSAYLIFTLCFLENPERVLSETQRVLRGEGRLHVCIVPEDSGLGREYSSKKSPFYRIARFYSEREAESMIREAGFEVETVKRIKLLHSENDFVCLTAKKS